MKTVVFDRDAYKRFRAAYDAAVASGAESFTFDGNEYLAVYAKHVLQYLETELGEKRPRRAVCRTFIKRC